MSEAAVGIVLPTSLDEILASIAEFSEEQFATLLKAVNGPEGLSADKERCERLAGDIGVPPAAIGYLFGALNFVYSALPTAAEQGGSQLAGLRNILAGMDLENGNPDKLKDIEDRVSRVLLNNDNLVRYKKISKLRDGFIKSAVSFSSFVDLRPNFSDEKDTIRSVIPIVQFRVLTNSDVDAERSIVFQMDRKAVRRLREAIDYVTRKLDAIDSSDFLIDKIDEFDRS